jgi:hypothetical protein
MSLLQVLNLPTPKRLTPPGGAPGAAPGAPGAFAASAATAQPASKTAQPSPGAGSPDLRAASTKLKAPIEARQREALAQMPQLIKLDKLIEEKLKTSTGEERKGLLAKKAALDKRTAETQRTIVQAKEDLEAIDNPATAREELVTVLARNRIAGSRATDVEIQSPGLDKKQTDRNHDITTTTTSYEKGTATVDKVHDQRHVGIGGSTSTHAHETEVRTADSTVRTTDERKTQVSTLGKASVETKKSVEVETADGKTSKVEQTSAKEISAKGASHTQTDKKTNFDGSGTETTKTRAVERGEGKVIAKAGTSTTTTTASGTATKHDTNVSGGMVAGKDGYGATGAIEKGKTVTTKDGRQVGVVGGLHANVVCNVGEPKGDPPVYAVTVTVSFGGSVGVSAGRGKQEGSKASVDVSAKASEERSMTVTHMLPAAELPGYVQALQDASKKGGKVAATHREFEIIAAGVNQGWDAARRVWKGGGDITKQTTDGLTHSGDSIEKSESSGRGASVKAKVGAVGGGVGVNETDAHSTKVTRNDKGALDVEGKGEHGRERSVSGSLDVGVASLEVGTTHTHKTSFGYAISIDPKNDPDGKMVADLARCRTEVDYNIFIMAHTGKITVTGITKGHGDADATNTSVGVGGLKLGMGTHQGVDSETTRDIKGKVTHQKVAGHAGAGGTLGPLADSVDEDAVAEVDEKGQAELTLTRTTKDNHNSRARDRKIEKLKQKVGLAKKEGGGTGALATASDGEEDAPIEDKTGLKLSHKDLKEIGASACRSFDYWMAGWQRADEKEDWKKAGLAIIKAKGAAAVVAEELARFIGGDRVERMHTVERFIRGGWSVIKKGKGFEFPDAIRNLQDAYDEVTKDGQDKRLNGIAAKDRNKAIEECKRLEALTATLIDKIGACKDFSSPGTKGEMLHQLQICRDMYAHGIKGYAGQSNEDIPALQARSQQYMKLCGQYAQQQARLVGDLSDLLGSDKQFLARDLGDANKLLHQLDDLHNRWWPYFAELKGTMKKLGQPNFDMPIFKPDDAALKRYTNAADI